MRRRSLDNRSDDALRAELEGLRDQRRQFARKTNIPFQEDALGRVDSLAATARGFLEKRIAGGVVPDHPLSQDAWQIAVAYVFASETFQTFARSLIAEAPEGTYNPMTRAEHDELITGYDERIEAVELELRRRDVARRRQALEAEAAELG